MGASWEVGASAPPPQNILRISDRDVVASFVRDAGKSGSAEPLIASSSTKDHLKAGTSRGSNSKLDPWLQTDPWAAYRAGPSQAATPSDRMQQMEQRMQSNLAQTATQLRAEITAKAPVPESGLMEVDDDFKRHAEDRFACLEANMTELRTHQGRLETWIQNVAQSSASTNSKLEDVAQHMETQQEDLAALRIEFAQHSQNTFASMQTIQNDVKEEMQKGLTHITALLEKRSRTDRTD